MTTRDLRSRFRKRLTEPRVMIAPGIYDALSALIAEQAGFETVFYSGSALHATQLGRPDVGLLTQTELAEGLARVTDRLSIPVVADVDAGFGATAHVVRMVRSFERAGAAAIQMEDQQVVKPSSALTSRPVVPLGDALDKIRAAVDARHDPNLLISARTDAPDPAEAVDRCLAFHEAGADLVFPQGTTCSDALARLCQALGSSVPVVYNNMYPDAPVTDAAGLETLGIRVVIFPGVALQHATAALQKGLEGLLRDPSLSGGGKPVTGSRSLPETLETASYLAKVQTKA